MATEEQQTPTKDARRGGREEEEVSRASRQNSADAGKQASAPLYSTLKPVLKSMASPQLLWLPRLPNEDSPLVIGKFQNPYQAPPTLPPIRALPAAATAAGSPPRLSFLNPSPLVGSFPLIRRSMTPTKAAATPIVPLWSANNNQNGSFKAIFGGNLVPPKKTMTTATAAATQLPLPLHHQASFTFPAAPVHQTRLFEYNNNKNLDNSNNKSDTNHVNITSGSGGGSGGDRSPSSGDGAVAKSARPAHRRRKKPRVYIDGDDIELHKCNDPSSTSEDGSHGGGHHHHHQQQQQRPARRETKKVRWETGP